jgi:hypothetical protein
MSWKKWIGIGLIGLSGVWFACIFVVPFLALSIEIRGALEVVFIVLMEGTFYLGVFIIGKQVVSRYWKSIKTFFGLKTQTKESK